MKRYTHDYDYGSNLKASPNGIWVKYEDVQKIKQDKTRALFRNSELVMENTRLKELNRELHAELKDLCDHITRPCPADVSYPSSLRDINKYHRAKIGKDKIGKARDLLARIKEEG